MSFIFNNGSRSFLFIFAGYEGEIDPAFNCQRGVLTRDRAIFVFANVLIPWQLGYLINSCVNSYLSSSPANCETQWCRAVFFINGIYVGAVIEKQARLWNVAFLAQLQYRSSFGYAWPQRRIRLRLDHRPTAPRCSTISHCALPRAIRLSLPHSSPSRLSFDARAHSVPASPSPPYIQPA